MLVRTINNEYDLQKAMAEENLDHFTLTAYQALLDYFNDAEMTIEFNAVDISCNYYECDLEEIKDYYEHLPEFKDVNWDDEESVCDALDRITIAWITGNRTILYAVF